MNLEKKQVNLGQFAARAVADFERKVGAIPSSPFLAQKIVRPLPLENAKRVVELGAGKGGITQLLLNRMPADSRLIAIEIDPELAQHLQCRFSDPRLEVINACAGSAREELHHRSWERVDIAVASVAFGFLSDSKIHEIFSAVKPFLDEDSLFTLYQYAHRLKMREGRFSYFDISQLLDQHFPNIERRAFWPNFPPAFIFDCRM